MVEAENFNVQATEAYNNKDFATAAALFQQAFDLDPLQHTYSLNAGLGYYEAKQYDKAIKFFDLALTSKKGVFYGFVVSSVSALLVLVGVVARFRQQKQCSFFYYLLVLHHFLQHDLIDWVIFNNQYINAMKCWFVCTLLGACFCVAHSDRDGNSKLAPLTFLTHQ